MSPPVGATGIQTCNGDGDASADSDASSRAAKTWRVGANLGGFSSTVKLSGHDVDIREAATTVTLDAHVSDRVVVQGGLGAILAGRLEVEGTRHDVLPGWIVAGAVAYRAFDGGGAAPFVLLSASVGYAATHTKQQDVVDAPTASLTSVDVRVGVAIGWTIAEVLSPYLAARAFGGPVTWSLAGQSVSGGDRYHYQIGAGVAVRMGDRFDAYVEAAPLGEKRASLGVGYSF
jgi:hypothetical protein